MNEYRNRLINGLAHVLEHEHKTLASITIADIVAASKVSKRTFYENFNSKEACFLALYEQNSYRILNKVIALSQQHATQAEATLESIVQQILSTYMQELLTRSSLMARLYIDILGIGQQGIEIKYQILLSYAQSIHSLLNSFKPFNSVSTAQLLLFLSGVNEMALYHLNNVSVLSLEELQHTVKQIMQLFIHSSALLSLEQPLTP